MNKFSIPELLENGIESNIMTTPSIRGDKLVEEAREARAELKKFQKNPTKKALRLSIEEILDNQTAIFSTFLCLKNSVEPEVFDEVFNEAYKNHIDKLDERKWKVGGMYEIIYKPKG